MRRFLTTLMILLVVIVAGLSALILLVNPNDFREYMVKQVAERSGYQLTFEGPLRWHVWPQLSILTDRMSLTAPGAEQPLIMADNMRLDVALIPLLTHQLQVKQVMIKNAVIQLTPGSKANYPKGSPTEPSGTSSSSTSNRGWSFDIANLSIVDSVLVVGKPNDEQLTLRNINLEMEQNSAKQAEVELALSLNRDQRDLEVSLQGTLNLADYPQQITSDISQLSYQIKGSGLPVEGIKGEASASLQWQQAPHKIVIDKLSLTANDSQLAGDVELSLDNIPDWQLNLQAKKLNLENLLAGVNQSNPVEQGGKPSIRPTPVIDSGQSAPGQGMREFNGKVDIKADDIQWRGLNFKQVAIQATNQRGLLTLSQLKGQLGEGQISLPGSVDMRKKITLSRFTPQIDNIDISSLLSAFEYPHAVSGQLSAKGTLTGGDLNAEAFKRTWQGPITLSMTRASLNGMNFQQLIQQAVSRSTDGIEVLDSYDNVTALENFSAQGILNNGQLTLSSITGQSGVMSMTGQGSLNLVAEQCDVEFNIRINNGWRGSNDKLIAMLANTPIPIRLYGPWQNLSYKLPIEQVLRNLLQDEVKNRVNQWLDDNSTRQGVDDVKRLLDDL